MNYLWLSQRDFTVLLLSVERALGSWKLGKDFYVNECSDLRLIIMRFF